MGIKIQIKKKNERKLFEKHIVFIHFWKEIKNESDACENIKNGEWKI